MMHVESIRIPIDAFPIFSRFSMLSPWHSFGFRVVRAREYVAYDAASTYLETRQSGREEEQKFLVARQKHVTSDKRLTWAEMIREVGDNIRTLMQTNKSRYAIVSNLLFC